MKTLNVILLVLILTLTAVGISYSAFVITLTDMRVENIQIYRQDVTTGEPPVITTEMFMSMNYTLYNSGDSKGMNVVFSLSAAQKTAILNFVKPFVQGQATADGVTAPIWVQ